MSFMANDTAVKKSAAVKKTAPAPAKKATKTAVKKAAPAKKTAPARSAAAAPVPYGPPPGWYASAGYPDRERYWDGEGWDDSRGSRPIGGGPVDDAPSTQGPAAEADGGGSATAKDTITFRGRVMKVRTPTDDQLALWKRIATRASQLDRSGTKPCPQCKGAREVDGEPCEACGGSGDATTAAVLRLFDQAMTIIGSVLVDEADKNWLEDELLGGALDLPAAAEVVRLAVDSMIANRRATAPRNGPPPKARRRK